MPDQEPTPNADDPSSANTGENGEESTPTSEVSSSLTSEESSDVTGDDDTVDASVNADGLHFDDDELGEKLRQASDEELNEAPFGIIRVDDDGVIEFFNQYESDLSGMDPDEVHGQNFFTQVAPCTNNRLYRGRFKKGIRRGELDETFTYTYTYKMRPTLVDVYMYRDEEGNNWITVEKY